LGNSEAVAKEHYLQVTDEHIRNAVTPVKKEDLKQDLNQYLQASEMNRNGVQGVEAINEKTPEILGKALDSRGFSVHEISPIRIRNLADGIGDSSSFSERGLKTVLKTEDSSPELINDRPYDPVLEKLIQHWHSLPNEARLLIGDILDDHVDSEI
jgi:hypothetical protein